MTDLYWMNTCVKPPGPRWSIWSVNLYCPVKTQKHRNLLQKATSCRQSVHCEIKPTRRYKHHFYIKTIRWRHFLCVHLSAQNGPIRQHRPSQQPRSECVTWPTVCLSGSGPGLRPEEGRRGPEERSIMGVFFFRTTGPGRPPSVVLWVLVLLSWGPVLVLLQDPSRLVHPDQTDRSLRRPSEEADLQGPAETTWGGQSASFHNKTDSIVPLFWYFLPSADLCRRLFLTVLFLQLFVLLVGC